MNSTDVAEVHYLLDPVDPEQTNKKNPKTMLLVQATTSLGLNLITDNDIWSTKQLQIVALHH